MIKPRAAAWPLALLLAGVAQAQQPDTVAGPQAAGGAIVGSVAAVPVVPACALPAGTTVELELIDRLNSLDNHNGDRFGIRLRVPIRFGERIVVPAGATGLGEVVHAARARAAGKAGELIVAARYIEADGVRYPLRGFRIGASTGESNVAAAGATAVLVAPVLSLFIVGGNVTYPVGMAAIARLSAPVPIAGSCGGEPSANR